MEKPTTKICCYCGEELPVRKFWTDPYHKDGLKSRCKNCSKIKDNPRSRKQDELRAKGLKKCSKCGEEKPLSEFHKAKKGKYGLSAICKRCDYEKQKLYRELNKERLSKRDKAYAERNKERIAKYSAKRYKEKREEILLHQKAYCNSEHGKAVRYRYAETHKEQKRGYMRQYNRNNMLTLSCRYIKGLLYKQGFSPSDITPELIAEKRKQLKLERAYRLLTREINNQQNKE